MKRRVSKVLALPLWLALAGTAHAATVCVPSVAIDGSCTSGAATINAAIAAAAANDTVLVGDGTFVEFVTINKNVALKSLNGRGSTTLRPPATPTTQLGTVRVTTGSNGVQIGGVGQGFTIEGVDNQSPGIESAAVYFQGNHANVQLLDNEIIAAGDAALTTEFGGTISGFVIDGNEFSGQTFVGPNPSSGNQFTVPNVPRQLVVVSGGAGGGNTSNVTFTNNVVSGTAGGITSGGAEQGNTLVTIDSNVANIAGNTFAGTTTGFGSSLRTRGPNTTISANDFDSTGLVSLALASPGTAHVTVQNSGQSTAAVYAANTFDRAAYFTTNAGVVAAGIALVAGTAPPGSTIEVRNAVYDEQVRVLSSNVTINGNGATIRPSSLVSDTTQGSPCGAGGNGTAIVLVSGVTGVVLDDLNVDASLINPMPARLVGTYYRNASGAIVGGSVSEVRNKPLNGAQNGLAILVQGSGANVADVDVSGVVVSGYQKNGITFNGCGCADAVDGIATGSITGSVATGAGPTSVIAQNGIQVGFGAGPVQISGNTITGHRYTGNPANGTASGILVFSSKSNVVDGNEVQGGNNGIVLQSGSFGLCTAGDTTGNTVSCNRIAGHDTLSYEVGVSADAAANTLVSNAFADNTTAIDGSAIASGELLAESNFWGAGDGPSGVGPGSGDPVTANVDFDPFLASVPACVSCSTDAECDDGLACTGVETCDLGSNTCQAGTPVVCSGQCESGVCLEPSGTCELALDGTSCNATPDSCSIGDSCVGGSCVDGGSGDPDGDGVCEADDNCPGVANPSQSDLDGDDVGDACDANDAALNVTRTRIRRNTSVNPAKPNGLIKVSGDLIVDLPGGDALSAAAGMALRVVDDLALDTANLADPPDWAPGDCKVVVKNTVTQRIQCKSPDKRYVATIRAVNPITPAQPQVYKFTFTLQKIALTGPFDAPVTTTLTQGTADRVGTIQDCQSNTAGLTCKEG